MKTTLSISVKKPCSENFTNFNTTKKGGFCMSCEKEVIDFRKLPNEELVDYFKNASKETCGIFTASQLTSYEKNTIPFLKSNTITKGFGLVGFSLLAICTNTPLNAQEIAGNEAPVKTELYITTNYKNNSPGVQETYAIKGTIVDEANEALPGVNIVLKGTTEGTQTDFDGKFEFPRKLATNDVLVFSYIGYETKEVKIKSSESSIVDINLVFDTYDMELMGEVVVGGAYASKRNIFQKFIALFR